MKVTFDETAYREVEIDGRKFIAGGLRISQVPFFNNYDLEDKFFSENEIAPNELLVGQVVGLTTTSYGAFEKPFVVTERTEETDDEAEKIEEIIRLGFCGSEDVTDGVILTREQRRGFSASYYDYEWKGSRFVVGDEFTVYLIPDMVLAGIFEGGLKKEILPYCVG